MQANNRDAGSLWDMMQAIRRNNAVDQEEWRSLEATLDFSDRAFTQIGDRPA